MMLQLPPDARTLVRREPARVQSLDCSEKGEGFVLALVEMNVWLEVPRLVMVRISVAEALTEVWIPKSSSRGETTMVFAGTE